MHKNLFQGLLFLCAMGTVLFLENYDLGISLHMFVYFCVATAFFKSLLKPSIRSSRKAMVMLLYNSILLFQLYVLMISDFSQGSRVFVAAMLVPTFFFQQIFLKRSEAFCVSTVSEENISFEDLRYLKKVLDHKANRLREVGEVITLPFLRDILSDLPRNCAISYMAKESLSDTYFENLEKSLTDPYVYLVFSDTGSAASNMIGIFTNKPYNHMSISFDAELKTLVSYNGGERVSPPGMNQEMIEWFYQKEEASIRIYRLKVTQEQKTQMAERIRKINKEGSAYNLVGVAIGKSIQPNIMVCSEFVYGLLQSVGAAYFTKPPLEVKPSDMIELDYERKLEYVETIHLHDFCEELVVKGKPLPKAGKPVKLNIQTEKTG